MGLARLNQVAQADNDLTASGVTLGTFDYISPEQARDPRSADVRSDMYSLGCSFFYMLTGRPPFPDGTVLQKLLQHQADHPPDPRGIRPELPPEVARILTRLLSKNPAHRYQKPAELSNELVALGDKLGIQLNSSRSHWEPARSLGPANAWQRHLPWAVPLAALFLTVLGLDFYWSAEPAAAVRRASLPPVSVRGPRAPSFGSAEKDASNPPLAAPLPPRVQNSSVAPLEDRAARPAIARSQRGAREQAGRPRGVLAADDRSIRRRNFGADQGPGYGSRQSCGAVSPEPERRAGRNRPIGCDWRELRRFLLRATRRQFAKMCWSWVTMRPSRMPMRVCTPPATMPRVATSLSCATTAAVGSGPLWCRTSSSRSRAGNRYQPVVVFRPEPDLVPLKYPPTMLSIAGGQLYVSNVHWELDLPRNVPSDWACSKLAAPSCFSFSAARSLFKMPRSGKRLIMRVWHFWTSNRRPAPAEWRWTSTRWSSRS